MDVSKATRQLFGADPEFGLLGLPQCAYGEICTETGRPGNTHLHDAGSRFEFRGLETTATTHSRVMLGREVTFSASSGRERR